MRKCKQIIELTSQRMDTSLPLLASLEVQFHLLICHTCRRYAKQLSVMQHALSLMEKYVQTQQLSATAKRRIAKNLKQANLTQDK